MKVSLILAVGFMFVCSCAAFTELNHYVAYNDNVYHWNVSETVITKPTYTVYNIYLTSQVCFLKFYNYFYINFIFFNFFLEMAYKRRS